MNTFSELFCLCFLGFYTLLLLGLLVVPPFRYRRLKFLNRRNHKGLLGPVKSSSSTECAEPSQDCGTKLGQTTGP